MSTLTTVTVRKEEENKEKIKSKHKKGQAETQADTGDRRDLESKFSGSTKAKKKTKQTKMFSTLGMFLVNCLNFNL